MDKIKITVSNLNVWFHGKQVIESLDLSITKNRIVSVIGPASSGKTLPKKKK